MVEVFSEREAYKQKRYIIQKLILQKSLKQHCFPFVSLALSEETSMNVDVDYWRCSEKAESGIYCNTVLIDTEFVDSARCRLGVLQTLRRLSFWKSVNV